MTMRTAAAALAMMGLVAGLAAGQDYTDECPEKFGFYADAVQCDRYYECKDGEVRFQICPNERRMAVLIERYGKSDWRGIN